MDTNELRAVVAKAEDVMLFLIGFQHIDGLSFGDAHPTIRGNFWWRSVHLPKITDALNNALALADDNDRLRAELAAAHRENDRLRNPVILDQNKKPVGTAVQSEIVEAFVDDAGTAWTPATGWAYRQVCVARDKVSAELAAANDERARLRPMILEEAAKAVQSERLDDPQPGTSDEAYEQALTDAAAAIRALEQPK